MGRCVRIAGAAQYEVAVRPWRWTAIVALTCLALATAYLPPQPGREAYARPESEAGAEARLNIVNRAYARTQRLLSDVRFRDSLSAAVRRAGSQMADVEVTIRGELPEASRRAFRGAVERVWQRTQAIPGARLLVLLDIPITRERWHPPWYVLPSVIDGRTCAASFMLDWNVGWLRNPTTTERGTNLQPWLTEALGPCLFYGAFGQPGPRIEKWLQDRSYKIANTADWDAAQPALNLPDEPHMVDMLIANMSFDALGCTGGQLPRCRDAVMHASNESPFRLYTTEPRGIAGVVRRAYWPRSFAADEHYLAALVKEMGPDRFGRFWRSTSSVDSAFVSAFDQPLEVWTAQWARKFAPELPPFGPAPRPIAVVFGFAMVAIAIAATVWYTMRRQVS
jgi:hypothetical protein